MTNKRVMVDMSATLLHHWHIRLLKKAKKYWKVIVWLTTDEEIKKKKWFTPELNFEQRKEILEAIKYVDEVVPTPWLITDDILDKYNIDILIHWNDNSNQVKRHKVIIFERTEWISSTELRKRVLEWIIEKYLEN